MIRTLLTLSAGVLLAIFLLVSAALLYVNTPTGRTHLSHALTDALDRQISFEGRLSFAARWPLTLRITHLIIANAEEGEADTMASIGQLEIAPAFFSFLTGNYHFHRIGLHSSSIHVERYPDGKANWQFGSEEDTPTEPADLSRFAVAELDIHASELTYWDAPENINIQLTAETQQEKLVVTGKGTYGGHAFSLNASSGVLLASGLEGSFPLHLHVTVGRTTLTAEGSMEDPFHKKGMDLTLQVKGADASELFPLLGIALPPTPPYNVQGQLTYETDIWRFLNFHGTLGSSDLRGDLTWDKTGERPKLTADFLSKTLDFADLGPLIGLKAKPPGAGEKPPETSPYVIPDVPLDITRLSAMDAAVTFTGQSVISPGLPLDDFYLNALLDDRILTLDPVKFGTANGDIAARLTINSRITPMSTDAHFSFKRLSLARLTEGIHKALNAIQLSEGYIGGTATLSGKGASLHDMLASSNGTVGLGMEGGTLSNLLIELMGLDIAQSLGFFLTGDKPVNIRCIIGNFGVENGLMTAKDFVIDTEDTNVTGEGTLQLGSEALNLRFKAEPKDSTPLSLRTPLRVEGTLKKPNVIIEKTNLAARGGAAIALAVAVPVAAILAFIEPGLGEDSNCAQLLHQMNKDNGKTTQESLVPRN